MRRADQVAGGVVLLFAALVIFESLRIPEQAVAAGRTNFAPVPGFLPMWTGVILAVLSVLLIVNASLRGAPEGAAPVFPRGRALAAVALLTAAVALYIAFLESLGYLLATFLLIAFLLRAVMGGSWRMSVGVAAVASFALLAIFKWMLGVDLPAGPFGI